MRPMRAGRLRHRIVFEEFTTDLDSDGAVTEEWTPVFPAPVSAEITAISGRELIVAASVNSKVTTRIRVRYRPGFKPALRGIHRGTVYNIEAVIPDPDSGIRALTLLCSSGVQHVNETAPESEPVVPGPDYILDRLSAQITDRSGAAITGR